MKTGIKFTMGTLIMCALLFACGNPYNKIGKRPPLTAKDSAALIARCVAISPLDTTTTHFIPQLPTVPDSTSYFKQLADSIFSVRQSVREVLKLKYKDTCTSVPYLYEDGFNTGFDAGSYDGRSTEEKTFQKSTHIADSLHRLEVAQLKTAYNTRLIQSGNAERLANEKTEKYRLKFESWQNAFIWASGAAALFLIISILLWKFRRQARSANNIVNDVKDFKK